ncbi:MAG: hypothetical protein KR126chlam4_00985 [Candidatus Anoxychlamydiales bacterium]|nr:hypothetical protein [Candidatus Anoxychlamydiales bacterium]NGX41147.1 hypothetical protein [Candidatus Anoxychlamydiales bacterium]
MSIKTVLQRSTLNNDFLSLVNKAKENISFWGNCYITIPGLNEEAPIDTLAARVIKLVQQQHFEYSQEERNIGSLISKKIDQLYDANDCRFKKCNILTKLFCNLRYLFDLLNGLFTTPARDCSVIRWNWRGENKGFGLVFRNIFNYYTKKQYEKEFGVSPSRSLSSHGFKGQKEGLWLPPHD